MIGKLINMVRKSNDSKSSNVNLNVGLETVQTVAQWEVWVKRQEQGAFIMQQRNELVDLTDKISRQEAELLAKTFYGQDAYIELHIGN